MTEPTGHDLDALLRTCQEHRARTEALLAETRRGIIGRLEQNMAAGENVAPLLDAWERNGLDVAGFLAAGL
ncbi:hypothetical protein [Streptomyces sp. 8L]|uniref:hypothetical protein n=1 Tax=Streptomyces sp. 8L TaxID=2877242 RepID=UPI001CD70A51|nr:hypothetical protein [Streptomyces sp. 8L]MCA1223329.1 hypothetical protein [Streptomyces sp. 8L]